MACLIGKSILEIEELPYQELLLWRSYLMEPRGDARADYHSATITQAIYSIMASFGKNSKPPTLDQCLLKFGEKHINDPKVSKSNLMTLLKLKEKKQ